MDKRIPVDQFLTSGTIEYLLDKAKEYEFAARDSERKRATAVSKNAPSATVDALKAEREKNVKELDRLRKELSIIAASEKQLLEKAETEEKAGKTTEAAETRKQIASLHSPDFPIEMIFTVYRTTKGKVLGDPVYASLKATNRGTGETYTAVFPIHEYYTNREMLPSIILAGSRGALSVEVRCLSDTQYLGMSEGDLYILASSGNFGVNFMKGMLGVWLEAMILTAIGVFAGTFLSWPVALLTTLAFWAAGLAAFGFLQQIAEGTVTGGGPFESLVRVLSHNNQVSQLAPTVAVVAAKTLDALVMPVLSRLAFIVPNLSLFDFSNLVSNGYAVSWAQLIEGLLLAVGYSLPFTIAGYLVLKNREVAA